METRVNTVPIMVLKRAMFTSHCILLYLLTIYLMLRSLVKEIDTFNFKIYSSFLFFWVRNDGNSSLFIVSTHGTLAFFSEPFQNADSMILINCEYSTKTLNGTFNIRITKPFISQSHEEVCVT